MSKAIFAGDRGQGRLARSPARLGESDVAGGLITGSLALGLWARQAAEQYLTSFHDLAHFLRQVMGRPQTMHGLVGR